MAKDESSVSESATVVVSEEAPADDVLVDDEAGDGAEPVAPFSPRCSDHACPWHEAEQRLGVPAREVTLVDRGDYRILMAQPAEGDEVHLHKNLGRF